MSDDANPNDPLVTRERRGNRKKSYYGDRADKLNHSKRTAIHRTREEIADDNDDWRQYETR